MPSPDYKNSIFKNDENPLDDQAYVINIFITTTSTAGRGKQIESPQK